MIIKYEYENKPVTFNFGDGNKMVNATEMAKVFGKRPNDFLVLPTTEKYINALITRYSCNKDFIVKKVRGRYNSGTWMHEKLALKFAAWLNVDFELWVFDKIEELLTSGQTSLDGEKRYTEKEYLAVMKLTHYNKYIDNQKEARKANISHLASRIRRHNPNMKSNEYAKANKLRNKDLEIDIKEIDRQLLQMVFDREITQKEYKRKKTNFDKLMATDKYITLKHAVYDLLCANGKIDRAKEIAELAYNFAKEMNLSIYRADEVTLFKPFLEKPQLPSGIEIKRLTA